MEHTQVFATKMFQISPTSVALLTRVPGFYWSSKLMLFHFNVTTNRPTHAYELADTWGDAGNSYLRESVITKTQNNTYQIKITSGECNPIDGPLSKRHCVDSLLKGTITNQAIAFNKRLKVKDTIEK
ncbi:hypothetical protein [Rufibacter sp. LB8]|nr:hypothetical protein [Rufibacter sp. LB8]